MDEETPRPGFEPGTTGFRILHRIHYGISPMGVKGKKMNMDENPM